MEREIVTVAGAEFSLATIPKVAATSQRYALLDWAGEDPTEFGQVHRHPALLRRVVEPVYAIVRHPLDRLLSCYRDRIAGPRPSRDLARRLGFPKSFGEFVVALDKVGTGIDTHTKTQTAHLEGVSPALEIRLEDLPEAWEPIRAATGLGALPILNPSPTDASVEVVEPRTFFLALDLYREDFERWSRPG